MRHYDHVGGMRSMQRFTRATVLASSETARALGLGHPVPEDPQFEADASQNFPAFTDGVRAVKDGEVTRLGATAITAHYTPGHTPGATTWTWQSCEGARCLNMVYVDSLTAVANDTFRYTGGNGRPSIVDGFRASLRKVGGAAVRCGDSTHPSATGMDDKLARRTKAGLAPGAPGDPFVDAGACKALAEVSMKGSGRPSRRRIEAIGGGERSHVRIREESARLHPGGVYAQRKP